MVTAAHSVIKTKKNSVKNYLYKMLFNINDQALVNIEGGESICNE